MEWYKQLGFLSAATLVPEHYNEVGLVDKNDVEANIKALLSQR
jgi:hypothetical protein